MIAKNDVFFRHYHKKYVHQLFLTTHHFISQMIVIQFTIYTVNLIVSDRYLNIFTFATISVHTHTHTHTRKNTHKHHSKHIYPNTPTHIHIYTHIYSNAYALTGTQTHIFTLKKYIHAHVRTQTPDADTYIHSRARAWKRTQT